MWNKIEEERREEKVNYKADDLELGILLIL